MMSEGVMIAGAVLVGGFGAVILISAYVVLFKDYFPETNDE